MLIASNSPTGTAPKPNTRFLKSVLKNTTQHNAALQALQDRREEEVRARRREKERKEAERRSRAGRLTPPVGDKGQRSSSASEDRHERRKHRKRKVTDDEDHNKRHAREHRHSKRSRKDPDRSVEGSRRSRRDHDDHEAQTDGKRTSRRPDHGRSHRRSRSASSDKSGYEELNGMLDRHAQSRDRQRDGSRSRSRSRSRDRPRHRRDKKRRKHSHARSPERARSRSPGRHRGKRREPEKANGHCHDKPSPRAASKAETSSRAHGRSRSISQSSTSSDPLEHLVGPLPASQDHQPRPRGRGAFKNTNYSSAIDSHFSSAYDPSHDNGPSDSDATETGFSEVRNGRGEKKEDDWEMAVEALRDREKWRAKGAERMREAGWGDEVVKMWENAKAGTRISGGHAAREKDENDVVWAKRGEGREWDKGKVVDSDGDGEVELKPEWAQRKPRSDPEYGRLV